MKNLGDIFFVGGLLLVTIVLNILAWEGGVLMGLFAGGITFALCGAILSGVLEV
jgi:hypothetical protein